ncbi:hypothetical protein OUZ56_004503 [Daphnia magna]|uniref:Uncharacterized protein n=1 Tax=Daphnia magna TaxID=35525 RepID=A0ABQ9YQC6_9CRUS|nr:hypothetical protein OUZ56_004503 [Daphnia magna]
MDVEKDPVFNGSSRVMETLVHGFHDSGSGKDPWQGGRTRIKLLLSFYGRNSSVKAAYQESHKNIKSCCDKTKFASRKAISARLRGMYNSFFVDDDSILEVIWFWFKPGEPASSLKYGNSGSKQLCKHANIFAPLFLKMFLLFFASILTNLGRRIPVMIASNDKLNTERSIKIKIVLIVASPPSPSLPSPPPPSRPKRFIRFHYLSIQSKSFLPFRLPLLQNTHNIHLLLLVSHFSTVFVTSTEESIWWPDFSSVYGRRLAL